MLTNLLSKNPSANWGKLVRIGILLYVTYALIQISLDTRDNFWDYRIYYHAVDAFQKQGLPYDATYMKKYDGMEKGILHYTYPPITHHFFKIFRFEDYELSARLYLAFKVILMFVLIRIWRGFLTIENTTFFWLFLLFVFSSALHIDLRAGNVTIIIQSLLWLGFWSFVKERYLIFMMLVVLASFFKLHQIVFLVLLLFTDNSKSKWTYILLGCSLFFAFLGANFWVYPKFSEAFFLDSIGEVIQEQAGILSPSLYALIKHFLFVLDGRIALLDLNAFVLIFFLPVICGIFYLTFRELRLHQGFEKKHYLIFLACLLYSFLLPRFKDYDYILLMAPTFFIIQRFQVFSSKAVVILLLLITFNNYSAPPNLKLIATLSYHYVNVIMTLLIWVLYMLDLRRIRSVGNLVDQERYK